jgi:hypothetical protein
MKSKITRHVSPAAIAIALFFAWALVTHGAIARVTNPNGNGVDSLRQPLVETIGGHNDLRGQARAWMRTRRAQRFSPNFARYIGPNFLQYLSEDQN